MAYLSIQTKSMIQRHFKEVMESGENIRIEQINGSWMEFRAEIAGPPGTPYEGGNFQLEISISNNYPFRPPKVRFITKIWNPNVSSQTGAIWIDILHDQWLAPMTLRALLLSIQSLLGDTEAELVPQNIAVSHQFNEQQAIFAMTAQHWTAVYAGGPNRNEDYDAKTQFVVEMGVDEDNARAALSNNDWDLERVAEALFD